MPIIKAKGPTVKIIMVSWLDGRNDLRWRLGTKNSRIMSLRGFIVFLAWILMSQSWSNLTENSGQIVY